LKNESRTDTSILEGDNGYKEKANEKSGCVVSVFVLEY
jgi:hypothetical protein